MCQVLADMEQPFGGFVQIDVASFHEIRKDIRIVLRSAHLTQLEQVADQGQSLTTSQESMLHAHRRMSARAPHKSVARLDTSSALANAELRLTATPRDRRPRRRSITELFARTPRVCFLNASVLPSFSPCGSARVCRLLVCTSRFQIETVFLTECRIKRRRRGRRRAGICRTVRSHDQCGRCDASS